MLGAERFGLADACDAAITMQNDIRQMLNRTLKKEVLTDSETLFNVITRNKAAKEKRLIIDIEWAREAYNKGIIEDIKWIRREYNLGDAMTKAEIMPAFVEALETNQLKYEIEQSMERVIRSRTNEKEKVRL